MIRVQRMFAERVYGIRIYQVFQVFVIPCLDLLDLMRGTESVEEVDERNFSLDGGAVRNRGQVHNFLYAGLAQHCTSGLTTGINVGMISENR